MNKLRLLSFFVSFCCFLSAWTKPVDVEKAKTVATNFLTSKSLLRNAEQKELTLAFMATNKTLLKSTNSTVSYYIFNVERDNGYVIVSGDDAAKPILGYSNTGKYDENNVPPAFNYWMGCLQEEIEEAINNQKSSSNENVQEWNNYYTGNIPILKSTHAVQPLILTQWNQNDPYNRLCPNNYLTGCIATTMSQIMNYYKYPDKGTGIIPSYITATEKIPIAAIDFSQENDYDWSNMTNTYSETSREIEIQAVATLMRHTAASVTTDFLSDASAATMSSPARSWIKYFDYDASLTAKQRIFYSDTEWEEMLKHEIANHRPVFYSGLRPTVAVGHAFICDGYDDAGLFHFNWGWGGTLDGYFLTTALNLNGDSYNRGQMIIINIFPNEGNEENYEMKLKAGTSLFFTDENMEAVKIGEKFNVTAQFQNAGTNDFYGSLGIALVDENDIILEIIGTQNFYNKTTKTYYMDFLFPDWSSFENAFEIPCIVSDGISAGNYYVKAAVRPLGKDWMIINGQYELNENGEEVYTSRLDLEVLNESITDNSELYLHNPGKFGYTGGFLTSRLIQGEEANFHLSVLNENATFAGDLELGLYDESNTLVQEIETIKVFMGEKDTLSFIFNAILTVDPGEYVLTLKAKPGFGEQFIVPGYDMETQNEIVVQVGDPTHINQVTFADSFSVYPNPVSDRIYISNEEFYIQSIKIYDLTGRVVKDIKVNREDKISIPVSNLKAGTYLLSIFTSEGKVTKKIIKK
ncbi:MAG: thiol protease/hemagglutinin PrtT [Candidatus Azobacteroides sp.]|nr:thiol protease/hemagglutinin PrtT [Candidatus Azobacteroides sp.]